VTTYCLRVNDIQN